MKNQINYITVNKILKYAVLYSKTYPSYNCVSDHLPVIYRITKMKEDKRQYNRLQDDSTYR